MTRPPSPLLTAAAAASASLVAASQFECAPRLVWNASPSAPEGLYVIAQREPERGDFALVTPRREIAALIEERGYLPPETPLIKRVVAAHGDEVCRDGEAISINRQGVATALLADSIGRDMPQWRGCFTLGDDEFFLLNAHQDSLDGRYFGVTKDVEIIGVAILIRTRSAR